MHDSYRRISSRIGLSGVLVMIAVVTSTLAYAREQMTIDVHLGIKENAETANQQYAYQEDIDESEEKHESEYLELTDAPSYESEEERAAGRVADEGISSESTPSAQEREDQSTRTNTRSEAPSTPQSTPQTPSTPPTETPTTKPEPSAPPAAHDTELAVPSQPAHFSVNQCDSYRNSFQMYPDPMVQAIRIERDLRASDPETAALLRHIACVPQPTWIVGGAVDRIRGEVEGRMQGASASGKTPVFVIYTSPHGSESRWYASITGGTYHDLVAEIARGIGHYEAWVVLEPDALPIANQYSAVERAKRMEEFRRSIALINEHAPNARVYIDAGHSRWVSLADKAQLLREAGITEAHGFSLNVSNFQTTESNVAYGRQLSDLVGGKPFIIDTSRNGIGPTADNEWCNAPDRALGQHPDLSPGIPRVDGLLWIKPPGESDGYCNGGPQAGKFWMEYALGLVRTSLR